MMDPILLLPIVISFFTVLFLLPVWMKKGRQINLLWDDKNKIAQSKVVGSGGIIVVVAFIISLFVFVAYRTFYMQDTLHLIEIITLASVVLLSAGIGFIDDLLGWQHGGLSRRSRLVLLFFSAVPLMAISAGKHVISLPFLGNIDFGLFYPLLLIPLGIVGATSTFNFLAGFNGLEAGQGILLLSGLGLAAFFTQQSWLALIALCMVVALAAFLFFNFSPARVFPGDVLTYGVGSLIALLAILGSLEKIAVFFFIPFILETILKSRGGLVKASFGKPQRDGSLDMPYDKIYGLTHLSIYLLKKLNIKSSENNVVYAIWIFQFVIIILGFIIFGQEIF